MKRRWIIIAELLTLMMTASGCGNKQEQTANANNHSPSVENSMNENSPQEFDEIAPIQTTTENPTNPTSDNLNNNSNADINNNPGNSNNSNTTKESDSNTPNTQVQTLENSTRESKSNIGGIVRSVEQDSIIISQTLMDDNGMITIPGEGSPEEILVTIRLTDTTVFEHWTIQGSGSDIDKREGTLEELEKGSGMEAEGYYNGEEFMADKIIIEVYE